jgi:hypothetical protein
MKLSHFTKGLLLGASLVMASSAFAGEKSAIKIYDPVTINGKTIAPGKYQAEWTGAGNDVQLSIRSGNHVIATIPAKISAAASAYPSTGYSTKKEADGSRSMTNVFFGGKKYSLEFGEEVAARPATQGTAGNK